MKLNHINLPTTDVPASQLLHEIFRDGDDPGVGAGDDGYDAGRGGHGAQSQSLR